MYVEDIKRGTNKDIGPKGIFEMGSNNKEINDLLIKSGMRRSITQDMVQSIWKSFLTMDAI